MPRKKKEALKVGIEKNRDRKIPDAELSSRSQVSKGAGDGATGKTKKAATKKAPSKTQRKTTKAPGRGKSTPVKEVLARDTVSRREMFPGDVPAHEAALKALEQIPELPHGYGITRIVIMMVDPDWMHAYWEVTEGALEEARKHLGRDYDTAARVLRVKKVDGLEADKNAHEYFDIETGHDVRNWYLRIPQPDTAYQVDIGLMTSKGVFYALASSNVLRIPRRGMSDIIDEQWTNLDEGYFEKIYALSGGFQVGMGSLQLQEMMAEFLRGEVSSGAVGSFALGSGALAARRGRAFWLRLGAELIVYGATDPRAKVTLMGEPVKLREDGTFTARYALPDGNRDIPVTAVSPDGIEKREIKIIVERETVEKEPVIK